MTFSSKNWRSRLNLVSSFSHPAVEAHHSHEQVRPKGAENVQRRHPSTSLLVYTTRRKVMTARHKAPRAALKHAPKPLTGPAKFRASSRPNEPPNHSLFRVRPLLPTARKRPVPHKPTHPRPRSRSLMPSHGLKELIWVISGETREAARPNENRNIAGRQEGEVESRVFQP